MTITRRTLCLSAAGVAAVGITPLTSAGTAEAAATARITGDVNVRAAATTRSASLGVARKGATVVLAGPRKGVWQPVRHRGRVAYISSRYMTTSNTPSRQVTSSAPAAAVASTVTMPSGVVANGTKVAREVAANFPQIATMYGRRNEAGSDHNTGRAVDIMIPDYKSNAALGQAIAEHLRANASRLGITYVIWNQQIWSVQRSREGWRRMPNRGSDNANHKNHVHVSVR